MLAVCRLTIGGSEAILPFAALYPCNISSPSGTATDVRAGSTKESIERIQTEWSRNASYQRHRVATIILANLGLNHFNGDMSCTSWVELLVSLLE